MVHNLTATTRLSVEEFLLHPAAHERSELVRGSIRMMTPASAPHGLVSGNVFSLVSTYVRQHQLGVCFADSTGYALPGLLNTVRAPDASFVRAERLPPEGISGGFLQIAPDLAIEVLSPSESAIDLSEKLADYRAAGTPLVWIIDSVARTVTVISLDEPIARIDVAGTLTGGEVLPGFTCEVDALFAGLAPQQ